MRILVRLWLHQHRRVRGARYKLPLARSDQAKREPGFLQSVSKNAKVAHINSAVSIVLTQVNSYASLQLTLQLDDC